MPIWLIGGPSGGGGCWWSGSFWRCAVLAGYPFSSATTSTTATRAMLLRRSTIRVSRLRPVEADSDLGPRPTRPADRDRRPPRCFRPVHLLRRGPLQRGGLPRRTRPRGGMTEIDSCRRWRERVNSGALRRHRYHPRRPGLTPFWFRKSNGRRERPHSRCLGVYPAGVYAMRGPLNPDGCTRAPQFSGPPFGNPHNPYGPRESGATASFGPGMVQ